MNYIYLSIYQVRILKTKKKRKMHKMTLYKINHLVIPFGTPGIWIWTTCLACHFLCRSLHLFLWQRPILWLSHATQQEISECFLMLSDMKKDKAYNSAETTVENKNKILSQVCKCNAKILICQQVPLQLNLERRYCYLIYAFG